jgi:ParB family transcriptional regulator, chromosome partitioning protein
MTLQGGHTPERRGLGRGLDALLPAGGEAVRQVDIDLIAPNPDQPRKHFASDAIDDLADSIAQHGILQPLIVTRQEGPGPTTYHLIAGERRLQAARRAGLQRVPAIVREAQANQRLELALVENLQRADLGPLEEAEAFRRLTDEFGLTQEEAGRRVGRGRVAIANALRLLGLPAPIKAALAAEEISAGHARALLGAPSEREQIRLFDLVRSRGLNVRQTEQLVRSSQSNRSESGGQAAAEPDVDRQALEERLREALGTQVDLQRSRRGGRIVIHFYDNDDLDDLLGILLRGNASG